MFFSPGDIVQQPPKGLLLNSLLGRAVVPTAKPSMARQRIVEEERERVVEAYRLLKKRKQQQRVDLTANLEKLKNPSGTFPGEET